MSALLSTISESYTVRLTAVKVFVGYNTILRQIHPTRKFNIRFGRTSLWSSIDEDLGQLYKTLNHFFNHSLVVK